MKKAYWISLYIKVNNQENLKKYAETVTPIIKSYGGIPLVRGGKYQTYDGDEFIGLLFGNFQVMKKLLSVINQKNIKLVGR